MERLILDKLLTWKASPYRKPLVLKGVRQIGKTSLLKEFGRLYYEIPLILTLTKMKNINNFLKLPKM